MLKKFAVFLSSMVFLLSCVAVLPVSATSEDRLSSQYTSKPVLSCEYIMDSSHINVDEVYWFYFCGEEDNSDFRSCCYFFAVDRDCTISEENGSFTFSDFKGTRAVYGTYYGGFADGTGGQAYTDSYYGFEYFIVDTVNKKLEVKSRGIVHPYCDYTHVETNYDGIVTSPSLDVEVTFSPALDGCINRVVDDNGISAESKYFNMTVTNNCKFAVQFMMCIYDADKRVPVVTPDFGSSSNPLFNKDYSNMSARQAEQKPKGLPCSAWLYSLPIGTNSETSLRN